MSRIVTYLIFQPMVALATLPSNTDNYKFIIPSHHQTTLFGLLPIISYFMTLLGHL